MCRRKTDRSRFSACLITHPAEKVRQQAFVEYTQLEDIVDLNDRANWYKDSPA
jgi:hypothetical protein